jgi:hypothetical protein
MMIFFSKIYKYCARFPFLKKKNRNFGNILPKKKGYYVVSTTRIEVCCWALPFIMVQEEEKRMPVLFEAGMNEDQDCTLWST